MKEKQEVFGHPLQENHNNSDVYIIDVKVQSPHGKLLGRQQFERVADHKQDVKDGAVQNEGMVQKAFHEMSVQKSLDGAGAAAARAV